MNHNQYRIRIENDDELAAAREIAAYHRVGLREVTEPKEGQLAELVDPVTAVLIAAGVVAVAKLVKDWWSRLRGGLVIDLRPGAKDMFYRDRDVEFGYVMTIAADGKVTVDVKDIPDAAQSWIEKVLELIGKPASAIADVAKSIVGSDKVKVAAPSSH
jgi:hypothetical protein